MAWVAASALAAVDPSAAADQRRRRDERPTLAQLVAEAPLEGLDVDLVRGGDAVRLEGRQQRPDHTGGHRRDDGRRRWQVVAKRECTRVREPGRVEDPTEPDAETRIVARLGETLTDPAPDRVDERHVWDG